MNVRFSVTCACALAVLLTASTLLAQARDGKVANAARAAATGTTWTPDKTPWGDPDLQGTWSGDSAFGIPMQRPVELGTEGGADRPGVRREGRARRSDPQQSAGTPPARSAMTTPGSPGPSARRRSSSSHRTARCRRSCAGRRAARARRRAPTATARSMARRTSRSTTAASASASSGR